MYKIGSRERKDSIKIVVGRATRRLLFLTLAIPLHNLKTAGTPVRKKPYGLIQKQLFFNGTVET